ncbi:MAG TPA: flagellar export chaperone FlgN [Anaerovoracaceae bacterium]|nr:flagellar export chaperone FlgN [Anaerovoracaceae bacterium]
MTHEKTDGKDFDITLNRFHEYLTGILELYREMVSLLQKELNHILNDELQALDENMKSQQALMLRTKNFDAKLAEYQSALNITGSTLSEMALLFPEKRQAEFFELIGQFQKTLEEVGFYKEKCRVLLQNKLYNVDKVLTRTERQKDNTTYDQNAAEVRSSLISKAFEKKI